MTDPNARQDDDVELLIGDVQHKGWASLSVTRSMDQAASLFELEAVERWRDGADPFATLPFARAELRLGGDTVLTGHVDRVVAGLSAERPALELIGRSLTADLVDCTPELSGTEFRRATMPAIARALATPFGIEVVEEVDCGGPIALERLDRGDTAWEVIERLCRLRGVLACDDARGRLVLTRAGQARASGRLVQGENVLDASAELNGAKRFSRYIVIGQQASAAANDIGGDGDPDDDDPEERPGAGPATAILGIAEDPDVPRYRPRVLRADSNAGGAEARALAVWAATTARAKSLRVRVRVPGWRQPDESLWQVNQLVEVALPRLHVEAELLVMTVTYGLSLREGRTTQMVLVPPETLTPEPLAEKPAGTGGGWADVVPIR